MTDKKDGNAYELIAWSKSLKQKMRLVIHCLPNGRQNLYFSTDASICGKDIYDIYHT